MHGSHSETEGTQTTSEAVPSTTWVQHNDTCSDVYHHHQYNDTLYDDKFYNLVHDVVDHHNGFLYYYDSGEQ